MRSALLFVALSLAGVAQGLLIGKQAPEFTASAVVDNKFKEISLSDYRGKYVLLFFYPADFTYVCPTEIKSLAERYSEFTALNTEILGVSVDSKHSHLAWIQTDSSKGGLGGSLPFPLVADNSKNISLSYDILCPDHIALRGLFIIDHEGIVQHSTINNDAFGRNVDEILRTLKAIQYTQSNPGEVCPSGWIPGKKTMKPTVEGIIEYFSGSQ